MMTSESKSSEKLLLRALRGETLARPPFWLMRQAGRYLPEYLEIRRQAGDFLSLCYSPELAVEVTLQPLRRFAMDAAILFADILVVPDALGQALSYREGEGPVLEPVRNAAELRRLDMAGLHERLAPVYQTIRRLRQELPPATALIGFAGAPWTVATYMVEGGGSRDFTKSKTWASEDPESFQKLIDLLIDTTSDYLLAQIDAGADTVQIFDSWAGVLPETALRRWSLAPISEIARRIGQKYPNVPVIAFPRGVGAAYEWFARDANISTVSLDTTVALGWAGEHLQSHAALQGNLDPQFLVCGGAAMLEETERILTALSGRPFVFNLGYGIVPQTPPENVAALSQFIAAWKA